MKWNKVLDLDGAAARLNDGNWLKVKVPDDLAGSIQLVTDYQGARFGVENISGQATAYAPIIEKQLRDEGVIDDLAEVMVHAVSRQGGVARVFYTVVANEIILKYREWAKQYRDFLFAYPLAAVLLEFAKKSGLKDGALLLVHGNHVAVLAMRAGQVVAADNLQFARSLSVECGRIAQRIWSMCLESQTEAEPATLNFLVLQDAGTEEADVAPLCVAMEERAHAFPGGGDVKLSRVADLSQLLAKLPLSIGQIPLPDKFLFFCRKSVPWLAAILAVNLLVSMAMGLHWYTKRNSLSARLDEQQLGKVAGVSGQLASTVQDADRLNPELKRIRKMLDEREHARLIPALSVLLSDIRAAAQDRVRVTMVGAVSSENGGLISISFNGESLDSSFEAERAFIQELERRGYKVVKREVDSSATTGSMFKLSIIRSQR